MPDPSAASRVEAPPIRIGEAEWIIMREEPDRPAALVKYFAPSGAPAYFRCVSWAPRSADRRLIGRFATLAEAERSVPVGRRTAPSPKPATGDDPWEHGQVPWDAAPRRSDRYA